MGIEVLKVVLSSSAVSGDSDKSRRKRQISVRLPQEESEGLDRLVTLYKQTVPENLWTEYTVASMAVRVGIQVLTKRAERRAQHGLPPFDDEDDA